MIRVCFRTLIIPRGDSGFISLEAPEVLGENDVAVFAIYDKLTRSTVFRKMVEYSAEENLYSVFLKPEDTRNLEPKRYYWDLITFYNPIYDDDNNLSSAERIDSYYSAYELPECIISESALV